METEDKASLDCPVCMEQYDTGKRTPKMMPCLHTVCATCLVDLITTHPVKDMDVHRHPHHPLIGQGSITRYETSSNLHENDDEAFQLRLQIQRNGDTNVQVISNLASILRDNTHLPLQRITGTMVSGDIESLPPALPARGSMRRAPPLTPKPMRRSIPSALQMPKEPPIPRNIIFHCPLCRSKVDSAILQTNRYVVAHLRDLERLTTLRQPNSPGYMIPLPPKKIPHQEDKVSFIPEAFWCNTCVKPSTRDCSSHSLQPIEEYAVKVSSSLEEMIRELDEQLEELIKTQKEKEEVFSNIYNTFQEASRHLGRLSKSIQEVEENFAALKDYIKSTNDSPASLQKALSLLSKVRCVRELKDQLAIVESGGACDDIYLWHQNDKFYISTREPDQTIMVTIKESCGNKELALQTDDG